uniref:ATP-dependent DNA helicase n=1 Tax=Caenorhabditis japonica TaxID=281687 RepID=A0A8R1IVH7_CAEJA
MYQMLNQRQKTVVDRALELVKKEGVPRMMFVDGPGGTGQTFCYNAIYHRLVSQKQTVICVAHTGIAATLLPFILKRSELWRDIQKFKLTENQRSIADPDWAEYILKVGDGPNFVDRERQKVLVPWKNVDSCRILENLVKWVFPTPNNVESTKSCAVLTMDNKTALRINEQVLERVDCEEFVFRSEDVADSNDGLTAADAEVFATKTPQGLPPHILHLKVGAQVVLLRNLAVDQGLCNGTRMTIERIGQDVIYCIVNNPTRRTPDMVFLHRIRMSPTGKGANSCGFFRLQYPVRLAYACTVNKSQGQTPTRCGLVLHSKIFSHGQLYVAMSRVKRGDDFKLWQYPKEADYCPDGMRIRNVVYQEALEEDDDLAELRGEMFQFNLVADRTKVRTSQPQKKTDIQAPVPTPNVVKELTVPTPNIVKKLTVPAPIVVKQVPVPKPWLLRRLDKVLLLGNRGCDCFVNSCMNLLYSIEPLRERLLSTIGLGRFCQSVADVLARRSTSVAAVRDQLGHLAVGFQDVNDTFEKLIEMFQGEGFPLSEFRFLRLTINECQCDRNVTEHEECISRMSLTKENRNTFQDVYAEHVRAERRNCNTCQNRQHSIGGDQLGRYHVVSCYRDVNVFFASFMPRDPVEMYGFQWNLIAFSEYLPGHYRSWIKVGQTWVCVSDSCFNGPPVAATDMDLKSNGANLMLFEKCDP